MPRRGYGPAADRGDHQFAILPTVSDIHMHREGPPETILPPEPAEAVEALGAAAARPVAERHEAVGEVIRRFPRCLEAWAERGDAARDDIEAYAAYRVGYHRGLDRLRQNGWRGSGYVRWAQPTNRGFLRSVAGLAAAAARIGESDEAERCEQFLRQLDPSWPPPQE
jgi:hypothetical protein